MLENIKNVINVYNSDKRNYTLTIHHTNGSSIIQKILDCISKNKSQILNINVLEPSLEDVFIHLTGKSLRE
jgi:ABC-2 type transport system ATP-binding protein